MSKYKDKSPPKNEEGPQRGAKNTERQGTSERPQLFQEDRTVAPTKTLKKRRAYRKNR